MKNLILILLTTFLISNQLAAQGWTGANNNLIYALDNMGMVNPNVDVAIGTNTALAKLHVLGNSGIRIEALTPNNPNVSDAFMRIQPEVPAGLPNHTANNMNQLSTVVGSRVTGRRFGHLFMDIIANEQADAFAVRVDNGDNGVIDNVPFIVRASGNVGIGQLDPQRILNTNGQIRFENLPSSDRVNLIGVDGNGDVFMTNCGCNVKRDEKINTDDSEIENLRTEVEILREELSLLRELISDNLAASKPVQTNRNLTENNTEVNIYPNPTSTGFNVDYNISDDFSNSEKASLVFYNSLGQLIQEVKLSDNIGSYYFLPPNSENGFYLCNLIINDKIVEVKQLVHTK